MFLYTREGKAGECLRKGRVNRKKEKKLKTAREKIKLIKN
jgi:hypothetical protein